MKEQMRVAQIFYPFKKTLWGEKAHVMQTKDHITTSLLFFKKYLKNKVKRDCWSLEVSKEVGAGCMQECEYVYIIMDQTTWKINTHARMWICLHRNGSKDMEDEYDR